MNTNIQFELPNDQWEPATPPPGQIFMAMRKGDFEWFRPNMSADTAELQPEATLEQAADAVAARLARVDDSARVSKRRVDDDNQMVWQQVDLEANVTDGKRLPLSQAQVLTIMPTTDGEARGLLCMMLTAETDTMAQYAADFEAFLQSAKAV